MSLMSCREYSRHRGCSLAAVQKAIATGRIAIAKEESHGSRKVLFIDSDAADNDWEANTNPVQQRVATRREKGIDEGPALRSPSPRDPGPNQQDLFPEIKPAQTIGSQAKAAVSAHGELYSKARSVKETWEAKTAELNYKKEAGKLVDKEPLAASLFNLTAEIKENVLNTPFRISSIIYARVKAHLVELKENPEAVFDEKEIQDIITGELKVALKRIADGISI